MDLLEITEGPLAENSTSANFTEWFTRSWVHRMFEHYHKDRRIPIDNTWFAVGDNHIELFAGAFTQRPYTELRPDVKGDLLNLSMVANIVVRDIKVEGKMCIRHATKTPVFTQYEIHLRRADMTQHVGFVIYGDELMVNLCKYEFPTFDISLEYDYKSETKSLFEDEPDASKRLLLERFMVEYVTVDLGYMILRLTKKMIGENARYISTLFENGSEIRNAIRIHNKITHKAFKNVGIQILNLTNELIKRSSTKLYIPRLYGFTDDKELKMFTCFINNLNILGYEQREQTYHIPYEVIISREDDCVIVHIPVRFWELAVHFSEIKQGLSDSEDEDEFKDKLTFRTSEAHFVISIKRMDPTRVEFKVLKFKIISFRGIGHHPIKLSLDHIVTSAIETYIESVMEKIFDDKKLQEMAINQHIDLAVAANETDDEDLSESDSEEEEE